jgi:amino acid permease
MLSMPFVFKEVGLAQGIVLVSFTGTLSAFGLSLLAEAAQVSSFLCV